MSEHVKEIDATSFESEVLAHDGPVVIEIPIHDGANVLPMVPPGAPNRVMIDEHQPALAPA